jgi:Kef-type K+ transport system membrane component KefB
MEKMIKRLLIWAFIVAGVLMVPLLSHAPWTGSDFVFAGIVLFSSAALYEFSADKIKNRNGRIVIGIAVALLVLAIWAWAVA